MDQNTANHLFTGDERKLMNDWALRYVDDEKAKSVVNRAQIARVLEKCGSIQAPGIGQRTGAIDPRTFMRWHQTQPGMWDDKKEREYFLAENRQYCAQGFRPRFRPKVFDMAATSAK